MGQIMVCCEGLVNKKDRVAGYIVSNQRWQFLLSLHEISFSSYVNPLFTIYSFSRHLTYQEVRVCSLFYKHQVLSEMKVATALELVSDF